MSAKKSTPIQRFCTKVCYVYLLLDSRKPGPFSYGHWKFSHEPFYVGKGTYQKYSNRIDTHDENCKFNPFKARVISKIKRAGFEDCIRIKKRENLTSKEACSLEVLLIAKIGRRDHKLGPLTNLTDGGEGVSGLVHTVESREKMSLNNVGMLGKRHSLETIEKIRNSNLGKLVSEETKNKLSKSHLGIISKPCGWKHTDETKQKMSEQARSRVYSYTREEWLYIRSLMLNPKCMRITDVSSQYGISLTMTFCLKSGNHWAVYAK
jgi:hypothetical protein